MCKRTIAVVTHVLFHITQFSHISCNKLTSTLLTWKWKFSSWFFVEKMCKRTIAVVTQVLFHITQFSHISCNKLTSALSTWKWKLHLDFCWKNVQKNNCSRDACLISPCSSYFTILISHLKLSSTKKTWKWRITSWSLLWKSCKKNNFSNSFLTSPQLIWLHLSHNTSWLVHWQLKNGKFHLIYLSQRISQKSYCSHVIYFISRCSSYFTTLISYYKGTSALSTWKWKFSSWFFVEKLRKRTIAAIMHLTSPCSTKMTTLISYYKLTGANTASKW
jgi:hypothetical protein